MKGFIAMRLATSIDVEIKHWELSRTTTRLDMDGIFGVCYVFKSRKDAEEVLSLIHI